MDFYSHSLCDGWHDQILYFLALGKQIDLVDDGRSAFWGPTAAVFFGHDLTYLADLQGCQFNKLMNFA